MHNKEFEKVVTKYGYEPVDDNTYEKFWDYKNRDIQLLEYDNGYEIAIFEYDIDPNTKEFNCIDSNYIHYDKDEYDDMFTSIDNILKEMEMGD